MQDDACAPGCFHPYSDLQFLARSSLTPYTLMSGKRKKPEIDGASGAALDSAASNNAEEEENAGKKHVEEDDVSDPESESDAAALQPSDESKYSDDGMGLRVEHISPEECAFLYEVRPEPLHLINIVGHLSRSVIMCRKFLSGKPTPGIVHWR
jgi:hypothetical protein